MKKREKKREKEKKKKRKKKKTNERKNKKEWNLVMVMYLIFYIFFKNLICFKSIILEMNFQILQSENGNVSITISVKDWFDCKLC